MGGNDILQGTDGNDQQGGLGNDRLDGYNGRDVFLFNTAPNSTSNFDTIVNYVAADDTIQIENTGVFASLTPGTLAPAAFKVGAAATDATDRIVYNSKTGDLFYDFNGSVGGGANAVKFAQLDRVNGVFPTLTAADIVVIYASAAARIGGSALMTIEVGRDLADLLVLMVGPLQFGTRERGGSGHCRSNRFGNRPCSRGGGFPLIRCGRFVAAHPCSVDQGIPAVAARPHHLGADLSRSARTAPALWLRGQYDAAAYADCRALAGAKRSRPFDFKAIENTAFFITDHVRDLAEFDRLLELGRLVLVNCIRPGSSVRPPRSSSRRS